MLSTLSPVNPATAAPLVPAMDGTKVETHPHRHHDRHDHQRAHRHRHHSHRATPTQPAAGSTEIPGANGPTDALSDPTPVTPAVPNGSTDNNIPDDNFAYLRKADITLILNTSDAPFDLGTLAFKTTTCLVYSENIVVSKSVHLPSQNLGLFCNSLTTVTNARQPLVTIDLSGNNPVTPSPVTQGPGTSGVKGGSGGQAWIFVQHLTDDVLQTLKVTVVGGDGSIGGATTDPGQIGGQGGPGGNGGNVMFTYGTTAWTLAAMLHSLSSAPWPKQAADGHDLLVPGLQNLGVQDFPAELLQPYSDALSLYNTFSTLFTGLISSLQALVANSDGLSPETLKVVSGTLSSLSTLQNSATAPNLAGVDASGLKATSTLISKWLADDPTITEDALVTSLAALPVLSGQADSALTEQSTSVFGYLVSLIQSMQQRVRYQLCDASKGNGGPGGTSGSDGSQPGGRGSDGTDGTILARNLAFDGRPSDLAVPQAYAFPDQCQMLLNKADALYFTNNNANWKDATVLYERLAERLAFVPLLTQPVDPSQPTQFSQLYYSYTFMEMVAQITTSSFAQLQSIYAQVKARLNQLGAGLDMFGHTANWTPRLSFIFYQSRVTSLLSHLKTLEKANTQFINALTRQTDASDSIQQGLDQIQTSLDKANDRIALLTDTNGPLAVSAAQISVFTPELKDKRTSISAEIAKVHDDIQNNINISPQLIINAFSMIAFCPSSLNVLTQAVSAGYSAWTQVPDDSGVNVDKANVISQLATCSDTLGSLSDAYSTRKDDTIEVDDPGAMKIIATVDAIKTLVDKFKSAIPDGDRTALSKSLDDYVGLINQRNDAVLTYNSALQLLLQALQDKSYYEAQQKQLGQDALKIDPNLPSIAFWLKKQMNDAQLDIMQRLNFEARAIRYWGLLPPFSFADPGPLRGSDVLEGYQESLNGKFEDAASKYGQSIWTWWPSTASQPGLFYQFSPSELAQIKKAINGVYGVIITLNSSLSHGPGGPFVGRANIRLNQVRVWLLGAKVNPDPLGRNLLVVEINQSGNETLLDSGTAPYSFSHDPVNIQFAYDARGATSLDKCTSSIVLGTESIENDFTGGNPTADSMAPIGPFSRWRVQVKQSENAGVDLSGVTAAYIEFWGRNMPFSA